jgi:hypothetical protein
LDSGWNSLHATESPLPFAFVDRWIEFLQSASRALSHSLCSLCPLWFPLLGWVSGEMGGCGFQACGVTGRLDGRNPFRVRDVGGRGPGVGPRGRGPTPGWRTDSRWDSRGISRREWAEPGLCGDLPDRDFGLRLGRNGSARNRFSAFPPRLCASAR